MSGAINVEKKINIFTVKLANNKKFIITVYDNDIIISTLINNIFDNTYSTINKSNKSNNIDIDIVYKIHTKLLANPIENKQFIQYNYYCLQGGNILEFIFEVIPETIIIEENKINSIVKIINDTKLVITVFYDNIFITKIKDNYRPSIFYYNHNCKHFDIEDIIAQINFSQTQKIVFSQHYSYIKEACNPTDKSVKTNVVPLKTNDVPVKTNDETVKPNYVPVKNNDVPVKTKNEGCISQ